MNRQTCPTMAIAYDFDGSLAPGNMQEHQFLPKIGVAPQDFWEEVDHKARANQADPVLVYMNMMLRKAQEASVPVRRKDFRKHGKNIDLFPGVRKWFDRMTSYALHEGVILKHYLISAGNTEIIRGTAIASKFEEVFASKYYFSENKIPVWPALAVNHTMKTQYLFRINKGIYDVSDNERINEFVARDKRPVPFEHMIYIGDGPTDVPCFRLVKEYNGLSIAVFAPDKIGAESRAMEYLDQGRVHCVLPAVYTEGRRLDKIVKARIRFVASRADAIALMKVN